MAGMKWRDIPGSPGYRVSSDGLVRSVDRVTRFVTKGVECKRAVKGRELKPWEDDSGYLTVSLSKAGKKKNARVHSLVMLAFVGRLPEGKEVRHVNGDCTDNRRRNLKYGTRQQNNADRKKHGRTRRGERHHMTTLSAADVVKIRSASGTHQEIADAFGVSRVCITNVINRRTWAHV